MLPIERLTFIENELKNQGTLTVNDICDKLGVSGMTIRRDFNKLVAEGKAQRYYGGITLKIGQAFEEEYKDKSDMNIDAKQVIAQYCFDNFIKDDQIIYLDTGSSVLELAKCIQRNLPKNLTIVTNDIVIANVFLNEDVQLIMVGGIVRKGLGCTYGRASDAQITQLKMDISFVGGLTADTDFNLYTSSEYRIPFKQQISQQCSENYILMDHSKFYNQSLFQINNLKDYTAVISDMELTGKQSQKASKLGINWVHATI